MTPSPRSLAFAVLVLGLLSSAAPAGACGYESPCEVDKGYYLYRQPAGWDGKAPLPVVVFYHGYGATAEEVMGDTGLVDAVAGVGALLVAPNGIGKAWSFGAGGMPKERDDVAFTKAVLDDLEQRFPVDKTRVMATGFSIGGSMTWWLACELPGRFTGFAPIAGAFWMPLPEECPAGPVSIRHIHGTNDKTVPMKGRSVAGGKFTQGDVMESWKRRKAWDGCPDKPDFEEAKAQLTCQTWSAQSCKSGHALTLCLHPGAHEIESSWVADGFRWMESGGRAE
jgi:polyhydroxybutyrate depolymerase